MNFPENDDEKQDIQSRLNSLNSHVKELESEIQNRKKTARKISEEVSKYSSLQSNINSKIQKYVKSKPSFRDLVNNSRKEAEKISTLLSQKMKIEGAVTRSLDGLLPKLKEM